MAASAPVRVGADQQAKAETEGERGAVPRAGGRGRWVCSVVLLVLGCVLLPAALAAGWARAQLTDTERYVAAVAPLSGDAAVQASVIADIDDAVMRQIDLDALLSAVPQGQRALLREQFASGIRTFVDQQVRQVVTGDAFPPLWEAANRAAHSSLMAALSASGPVTSDVTLDLTPVAERVRTQLTGNWVGSGPGAQPPGRLPAADTDVVLLPARDVPAARDAYAAVRLAGLWLPVAAAVCLALGLLLTPAPRRRAVIGTGLGCALTCSLLFAALAIARALALDTLPAASSATSRPAAGAYLDALTEPARIWTGIALGAGVLTAVTTLAVGRMGRAERSGRMGRSGRVGRAGSTGR